MSDKQNKPAFEATAKNLLKMPHKGRGKKDTSESPPEKVENGDNANTDRRPL